MSADLAQQVRRRRTFAIISHPDAGKTTLTEKLLLFSGAIQIAGSVKARKAARHATSDANSVSSMMGSMADQSPPARPHPIRGMCTEAPSKRACSATFDNPVLIAS